MADTQPSSLLQYLPAIYREDPFLGGFLLAFEKLLFGLDDGVDLPATRAAYPRAGLEQTVAAIATFFDPYKTPEDFLPWLASWTAFSLRADLATEKQRHFLANIISLYRRRGTKENLVDLLKIFTIGKPTVTEILHGNPPHFFTVTLTLERALPEVQLRQIAIALALVELEKPAHTNFELHPEFLGMQIGVTSTIGKDTQIGSGQYR
jgi:phage tail-like protein